MVYENRREICMRMRCYGPVDTSPFFVHNLFTHCTTVRSRISRLKRKVSDVFIGGCVPHRLFLFWG